MYLFLIDDNEHVQKVNNTNNEMIEQDGMLGGAI